MQLIRQATCENNNILNGNLNKGHTSLTSFYNYQTSWHFTEWATAVCEGNLNDSFSQTSDKGNYKIFTYPLSSPFFQDGENYAGKLYADVTLPVRETSMVVFDIVCTKQKCQSPVRKKFLSSDQVLIFCCCTLCLLGSPDWQN